MNATIRDAYFETQVTTATPQRLRLMLIEEALRRTKAAQAACEARRWDEGTADIEHGRAVLAELIGGIHPEKTPLAQQVLGIYLYMLSALAEAQFGRDSQCLADVVRVLEEERHTWQAVCQKMPERPAPASASAAHEELAPQRVPHLRGGYAPTAAVPSPHQSAAAFSIEA